MCKFENCKYDTGLSFGKMFCLKDGGEIADWYANKMRDICDLNTLGYLDYAGYDEIQTFQNAEDCPFFEEDI